MVNLFYKVFPAHQHKEHKMAHVNSLTVQTTEGPVEVTKTSTHRDYVAASVVEYADRTQVVLSWHLTEAAAYKYVKSAAAQNLANYNARKLGTTATLVVLPVTTKLTGKDAKEQAPEAPEAPAFVPSVEGPEDTDGTCRCGCGEAVGAKSQYRPGHDARHAAAVAVDIASSALPYYERVTADSDLGSEALVRKAHAQAERLVAKQAAKQARLDAKRTK